MAESAGVGGGEGAWADTAYFAEEMARYEELQRATLERGDGQYIIFNPVHTGMGNRIEGMLSTFLLAYLTDRAFIVEWDVYDPNTRLPHIEMVEDEVFEEPFPWGPDLLSARFPKKVVCSLALRIWVILDTILTDYFLCLRFVSGVSFFWEYFPFFLYYSVCNMRMLCCCIDRKGRHKVMRMLWIAWLEHLTGSDFSAGD